MLKVTEEEFQLIVSQWKDKASLINVWILYPGDRFREFTCTVESVSATDVVLLTEDGRLRILPFGYAKFSYDTPDNAPLHVRESAGKKFDSALRIDWEKPGLGGAENQDAWLLFETKDKMPGAPPVTTSTSN